jgi:alpha-ribazole phosphatase
MALILVRHTRPQGAEGLCYGRTDLDLDASFDAHAARLGAELPAVVRILSSPLSRCLRLAQVLAGWT